MKFSKFRIILSFLLSAFLFSSCSGKNGDSTRPTRISIGDKISWAFTTLESTPEEAENLTFKPLKRLGYHNLMEVAGNDGKFIWLKIDFEIPEELKNQDLGLYVSYLHFADKVWINNSFSGEYGRFPPDELSAQYSGHFYSFSKELLNQEGTNTVLIKVYCLGRAEFSSKAFIGLYEDARQMERKTTFRLQTFYIQFEGGMFASFLIYMLMFLIEKRKHKEYLSFSLSCFFTLQFATIFFAPSSTIYTDWGISFLFFFKYCSCFCFYAGSFFLCIFTLQYIGVEENKIANIIRYSVFALQSILTFAAPTYYSLIRIAPVLIISCVGSLGSTVLNVIICMFNKKRHRKATILGIGLLPLVIGVIVDFIVHYILKITDSMFYMYIGWQCSIICYLLVLCVRFTRAFLENIYLTQSLRDEVENQTQKIKITSKKLEAELGRAKTDIQMASIVQQTTFTHTQKNFIGWDVGLKYLPLSEVSGDMYDFYNIGYGLNGFSLFDVSGHGIAASLITMLSKNIISQVFKDNRLAGESSADLLVKINNQVIKSKGSDDNYLTGLMFQIDPFKGDTCKLELANAGHPHPFLYKRKTAEAVSLIPEDTNQQYGAIGIKDMAVSFQNIPFEMETGDILVCFTDGITEIENENRQQFGREAVKQLIEDNCELNAQDLVDKMIDTIMKYAGNHPREDDITILILKREDPNEFIEEL